MKFEQLWLLIRKSVVSWVDDYASSMGAALAYYTMFSIAPLLLIVISIAGFFYGEDAARGAIFSELSGLIGNDGAAAVQGLLKSVNKPAASVFATVIGLVTLLIGATTVFGELQDALNRIWRAPALEDKGGLWKLLRRRVLAFGMILGIGFLLIVSLVLGAVLAAIGKWMGPAFVGWEALLQVINFVIGFVTITVLFAMIYKIMPRVHIAWRDVWLGAVVTALLFSIGKLLIGLYIGKTSVASGFGAAGSLVVLLVWIYYSTQIFLLGAEFTWVYANLHGSRRGKDDVNASPVVPARSEPDGDHGVDGKDAASQVNARAPD
ncbi:MAG: YihY/virulence factor BrkB family protein [Burkholderiaceae bacterium]